MHLASWALIWSHLILTTEGSVSIQMRWLKGPEKAVGSKGQQHSSNPWWYQWGWKETQWLSHGEFKGEKKSKLQLHKCQYRSSGLGLLEWVWQSIFLLCFHIYFLSTLGLGCIAQDLSLPCADFSLVAACGLQSQSLLCCLQECAITVPWPGVKPAWQGGLLTTGPPGKFLAMCFKGS